MSSNFRNIDRTSRFLFPESIEEWLPEKHLARFVVEILEGLSIKNIEASYGGSGGTAAYHPKMLLALILYGYVTGVFSSRKIEHATYDSVPFRYIAVNSHPDHDTIANFRKRFLPEIESLFTQVLLIANAAGCLKLGTVSIDGTKIHANASKHSALSYEHACKLEETLKKEVEELLKKAEAADNTPLPDGLDIPEEISRRSQRIAVIAEAKKEIERRAAERFEHEKKAYEEKMAARAKHEEETGKKPKGRTPAEPKSSKPLGKDQVNLTDSESRIMPQSGGGFEQSYNAQAVVDADSLIIVVSDVTQHLNDKKEMLPALDALAELPEELPEVERVLADAGYFSKENVEFCEAHEITPYIAPGRIAHNEGIEERFSEPVSSEPAATATERMKGRLKTLEGRKIFSRRKCTVEPVFGIIKNVMGFRQFLFRGLQAVRSEWKLVDLAYNIKRLYKLLDGNLPQTA